MAFSKQRDFSGYGERKRGGLYTYEEQDDEPAEKKSKQSPKRILLAILKLSTVSAMEVYRLVDSGQVEVKFIKNQFDADPDAPPIKFLWLDELCLLQLFYTKNRLLTDDAESRPASGENRQHLLSDIFIERDAKFTTLRKFYSDSDGELLPTRTSFSLNSDQVKRLLSFEAVLLALCPDLKEKAPCCAGSDHANQIGFLNCQR